MEGVLIDECRKGMFRLSGNKRSGGPDTLPCSNNEEESSGHTIQPSSLQHGKVGVIEEVGFECTDFLTTTYCMESGGS